MDQLFEEEKKACLDLEAPSSSSPRNMVVDRSKKKKRKKGRATQFADEALEAAEVQIECDEMEDDNLVDLLDAEESKVSPPLASPFEAKFMQLQELRAT
jgi:hypothetical protein